MDKLSLSAALAAMLLAAAPASALGIIMDIPRLDFPVPQPAASRDCSAPSSVSPVCTNAQEHQNPLDKPEAASK
jgi:hypothetical protein